MQIEIDAAALEKLGRVVGIQLSHYTLRAVAVWRRYVDDYDEAMIIVAVTSITADRLTRTDLDPEIKGLSTAVPRNLLSKCNISSIATATGMNRETARRKIAGLVVKNILERDGRGNINFAAGRIQVGGASRLIREQLEVARRFMEEQVRNGVLQVR